MYTLFVKCIRKDESSGSEQIDRDAEQRRQTLTILFCGRSIRQISPWVTELILIFTAAAMLHMPYYISHYISNTFPLLTLLSTQPQH